MKLVIGKTLWGVDADADKWDAVFARVKAEGFTAIECVPAFSYQSNPVLFKELLDKHDMQLVVQVHTNGGYFKDGAYVYCLNCDVEQHLESFRSQVREALGMGAMMINTHSGHDSWDVDTAVNYFRTTLDIEEEFMRDPQYRHVTIVHETHRQRLMFSPFQTRDILKHPQLKQLKINADLSHWWWPDVLNLVAEHCHFIHARVGHAEGPQVFDPRDEVWTKEVDAHLQWWEVIWRAQKARGMQQCLVEPEHGPPPYQQFDTMPLPSEQKTALTQVDKDSILWEINSHVKDLVVSRFSKALV